MSPHLRARLGIGWVAQEREIFPSLTVEENLTVASRPGRWTLDDVYKLLPRLKERQSNMGNQLSGGEQQMLAMARALMTNPALLLLDEPLEGLAPIIVEELTVAHFPHDQGWQHRNHPRGAARRDRAVTHGKRDRDRARSGGPPCKICRYAEGCRGARSVHRIEDRRQVQAADPSRSNNKRGGFVMKRSTNHLLTTHAGSLPRPADILAQVRVRDAVRLKKAVADIVRKQADIGIDVVDDGEYGKPSFVTYVRDRLDGIAPTGGCGRACGASRATRARSRSSTASRSAA